MTQGESFNPNSNIEDFFAEQDSKERLRMNIDAAYKATRQFAQNVNADDDSIAYEQVLHFRIQFAQNYAIMMHALPPEDYDKEKKRITMNLYQQIISGNFGDSIDINALGVVDEFFPGEPLDLNPDSDEFKEYLEKWIQDQSQIVEKNLENLKVQKYVIALSNYLDECFKDYDVNYLINRNLGTVFLMYCSKYFGGDNPELEKANMLDKIREILNRNGIDLSLAQPILLMMESLKEHKLKNE